jgi:uncharacterized membrane protein
MTVDPTYAYLAIGGMALITYATRAGGLWAMDHVPVTPRVESFLRHMASSVIVAIVVAAAWRGDWGLRAAIPVSVIVMLTSRNSSAALAAGMLAAAAWRGVVG